MKFITLHYGDWTIEQLREEIMRDLSPAERLCHWVGERERIRIRRSIKGEQPPWTNDPILKAYRFCNVRRMDDAVSKWLVDHWYLPNMGHHNMIYACALARFFNLPTTLQRITQWVFTRKGEPKWDKIVKCLNEKRANEERIFNAAYMVRGNDAESKVDSVVYHNVKSLPDSLFKIGTDSMKEMWEALKDCHGYGSFMAGQVVADMRWGMYGTWADKDTWAPVGPGSSRGAFRLISKEPMPNMHQGQFLAVLTVVIDLMKEWEKEGEIPEGICSRLEAIDYQNCMCEFDKYERCLWGEGRPKRRYP